MGRLATFPSDQIRDTSLFALIRFSLVTFIYLFFTKSACSSFPETFKLRKTGSISYKNKNDDKILNFVLKEAGIIFILFWNSLWTSRSEWFLWSLLKKQKTDVLKLKQAEQKGKDQNKNWNIQKDT